MGASNLTPGKRLVEMAARDLSSQFNSTYTRVEHSYGSAGLALMAVPVLLVVSAIEGGVHLLWRPQSFIYSLVCAVSACALYLYSKGARIAAKRSFAELQAGWRRLAIDAGQPLCIVEAPIGHPRGWRFLVNPATVASPPSRTLRIDEVADVDEFMRVVQHATSSH